MNKLIPALWAVILLVSCGKQAPPPLTEHEKQRRIDSMTRERVQEAEVRARKELEYRMKIEVKVKADSILKARSAPAGQGKTN